MSTQNPLLVKSTTPNFSPEFDKIDIEHFEPAILIAIDEANKNIDAIKNNPDPATFENTIEALEFASELLDQITLISSNLEYAIGGDDLTAIAKNTAPLLSQFSNDIFLDADLFDRVNDVKQYHDQDGVPALTPEQETLLDNTYKGFVKSGALLNDAQKARFREISQQLSTLGTEYAENIVKSSELFELHITDAADLSGLPDSVKEAAELTAKDKGKQGWVFTLDYPSYGPFITYSDNRALRETIWRAATNKAYGDQYDNCDNIKKIIGLKNEKAQLLGYNSTADLILESRMAKTPDTVFNFLNDLKDAYKQVAGEELDELKAFAAQDDLTDMQPWDTAYYSEKLQKELFDVSDEDLRPYLELDNVLKGSFLHFEKLFGIRFEEDNSYPKYHDDVKTFNVINVDDGSFVGSLMTDFHPRSGKKSGAWKTDYRNQGQYDGTVERPVISIVCNFTKPTNSAPSLLTMNEVTTLFHEMGHAVHGLLSDVTYPSLAGTSVKRDFVELPSQLQENWCFEKETLDTFATHHKTGEALPAELITKLQDAKNFQAGMMGLRQVTLGLLDMEWYTADPSTIDDVAEFERNVKKDLSLFSTPSGPISTSFGHIFSGGYSAGYYGYKWADVLGADAFQAFKENGLYDQTTAERYKSEVLTQGGTVDPQILYSNFRGRDADPDALLRSEGLLHDDQDELSVTPPEPSGP